MLWTRVRKVDGYSPALARQRHQDVNARRFVEATTKSRRLKGYIKYAKQTRCILFDALIMRVVASSSITESPNPHSAAAESRGREFSRVGVYVQQARLTKVISPCLGELLR
jgi:hypothetical protein